MIGDAMIRAFFAELAKEADISPEAAARLRFKRIHNTLKTQGADIGSLTGIKRVAVRKEHLTEADLGHLGFKKVLISVPESGQAAFKSYRHPISNHHVHDHGSHWVIHEDAHPSSTMLGYKAKLHRKGKLKDVRAPFLTKKDLAKRKPKPLKAPSRFDAAKATIQGMPHLIGEGVPGMASYLKGKVTGARGMLDRVHDATDASVKKKMKRWRPSKTHQMEEKTGSIDSQAAQKRHAYYMKNRQRLLAQSKVYRAKNRADLQRKKKIYRRQVKRGAKKQQRRVGAGSHGYAMMGYK